MKIHPENRIKTTGIIPKTGGLFRFKAVGILSPGKYRIQLSGTLLQIKSPVPLAVGKMYKAFFRYNEKELSIEKPEVQPAIEKEYLKKAIPEQKTISSIIENLHLCDADLPEGDFLHWTDKNLIEKTEKELFILEPLIIMYKKMEYKGQLSLSFSKGNHASVYHLDLKKESSHWRFRLYCQGDRYSIKAFCSRSDLSKEIQERWTQLCQRWKTSGIEADKSIKILRSFTENTENIREEMYRIIDIEV